MEFTLQLLWNLDQSLEDGPISDPALLLTCDVIVGQLLDLPSWPRFPRSEMWMMTALWLCATLLYFIGT